MIVPRYVVTYIAQRNFRAIQFFKELLPLQHPNCPPDVRAALVGEGTVRVGLAAHAEPAVMTLAATLDADPGDFRRFLAPLLRIIFLRPAVLSLQLAQFYPEPFALHDTVIAVPVDVPSLTTVVAEDDVLRGDFLEGDLVAEVPAAPRSLHAQFPALDMSFTGVGQPF